MEDKDLLNIWKQYDEKLEQVLEVNQQLTQEVTQLKVKSTIAKSKPIKWIAIALGIPWSIFLTSLAVIGILSGNLFFAISFGAIALIMNIVLGSYVYHLVLIYQVNNSDTVMQAQEKLAKLKISSIQVTRIAFLQLPFWTMFWLSTDILNSSLLLLSVHVVIFLIFGFASIWLYRNIKLENMNKKWMKVLFSGVEWTPIIQSMDMLEQIEGYKGEE